MGEALSTVSNGSFDSAEINRSVIPMTDLVRECFQSLIKKQEGSRVKLEMEELPSLIADEVLIRHMVKNIISNSIKYSAKVEKPLIRVSSYSEDSWYCYSFQDNGIGFDAHYASQVFNVFQRLHASDEYEGQYTLWLYSLDNEFVPVDKLCLYAVEDKEDELDPEEFIQYFSITSDYEIHLLDYSKTRQKTQSEEVYYIDDSRRFALRSSKTGE